MRDYTEDEQGHIARVDFDFVEDETKKGNIRKNPRKAAVPPIAHTLRFSGRNISGTGNKQDVNNL